MSIDDPEFELNKLPTEGDRKFGIIASLIVCIVTGFVPLVVIYKAFNNELEGLNEHIGALIVTTSLFIFSLILLYRIAFGKRRKLSTKQILIIGYIFGVASCIMALFALFSENNNIHMVVVSLAGLAMSIKAVYYGKQNIDS